MKIIFPLINKDSMFIVIKITRHKAENVNIAKKTVKILLKKYSTKP